MFILKGFFSDGYDGRYIYVIRQQLCLEENTVKKIRFQWK